MESRRKSLVSFADTSISSTGRSVLHGGKRAIGAKEKIISLKGVKKCPSITSRARRSQRRLGMWRI